MAGDIRGLLGQWLGLRQIGIPPIVLADLTITDGQRMQLALAEDAVMELIVDDEEAP